MVNSAIEAFGKLDILVNNAGILRDRMLVNMTEEEWDAVIAVHLKGHFVPTRWAAAYWREQVKAGETVTANVVNTSSTSGLLSNPGQTNYGAAKSGIATFTQIAAKELSRYGVKVNCIAPGRPHPAHRGDARSRRHHQGARRSGRRSTSGIREHLTARRLPRDGRLPVHRRDLLRAGRPGATKFQSWKMGDGVEQRRALDGRRSAGRCSASSQRRRVAPTVTARWGLTPARARAMLRIRLSDSEVAMTIVENRYLTGNFAPVHDGSHRGRSARSPARSPSRSAGASCATARTR